MANISVGGKELEMIKNKKGKLADFHALKAAGGNGGEVYLLSHNLLQRSSGQSSGGRARPGKARRQGSWAIPNAPLIYKRHSPHTKRTSCSRNSEHSKDLSIQRKLN